MNSPAKSQRSTRNTRSKPEPQLDWSATDERAVNWIRVLAMDAVERAGSGHPGTAMSLAPAAYLLFQRFLRHDPADPNWVGRDRFVLSCGHSSLTLYIQLYLSGYGLTMEDLGQLRQWGSQTPGHPEYRHTPGVEVTTGPLGQGVGNAVGMAMAARRERGLFDPDAVAGSSPFDHMIWGFASDGDMQEGVASEASSLAGNQQLGNLCLLWDDNQISIEDDTRIAFTEDVAARYAAYDWHVQEVDWRQGEHYHEDVAALAAAFEAARAETDRPSFIKLRTIIGWPAPTKQNTGKAHGTALGSDEVAATKQLLGFDPQRSFPVESDALEHARAVARRGSAAHQHWNSQFEDWKHHNSERYELWQRLAAGQLPSDWKQQLPEFDPAKTNSMATRTASGKVLAALADALPELWGGSADLAGSNDTSMAGEPSFIPAQHQTKEFAGGPYGRTLHFGVREHAMGAIMNGMVLHGPTRPYGGTFLVFSDYMRPSVRLAALMGIPVTYVWTHDSIGLGEDGPTHQPVEQLTALRAIPGLDVVRPGDANETTVAWQAAIERTDGPTALCLTRQKLPVLDRTQYAPASGALRGGYILAEASTSDSLPTVILLASGSEVSLVLAARDRLEADGTPTRVVSMPCMEWFSAQDTAYREHVLPRAVHARVAVEAGIAAPWRQFVGDDGEVVSLEHFGASAPYEVLYEQFGFTPDAVVAAAHASLSRNAVITGSTTGN
ncbi:MAG: transketolase [Acidimicrobiales bacterium]|nr:MAG: transketolase [Acidimicrobiales bacterium]